MATSSLICSLIGLGLLCVGGLVIVAVTAGRHTRSSEAAIGVVFIVVTLASFMLCLVGTIMGGRGMNEVNEYNRGVGVAGLVCGIIGLIISSLCGLITLLGMVVAASVWRW
jgi:hypothetical protein